MKKSTLYLFGLITLLLFPLPAFLFLHYMEEKSISEFLDLTSFCQTTSAIGLELGMIYAFFSLLLLQAPVFDQIPNRIEETVRNLHLTIWDAFFLSACAGIGEELLFRSGVQFYLGPWITSLLFVAIHGYLHPLNWRKSLYGLIVLPFILLISFGFIKFGLWFAIAAHFSYDFVLFMAMRKDQN